MRKLVRETEWERVYESDVGVRMHESKFLTDGITVSAEFIIGRWRDFSMAEKVEFANSFSAKNEVSAEDERILDYLMQAGDFYTWMAIASLLPYHRNRERALEFLLRRVGEEGEDKANFFQALGLIRDRRAIPGLRAAYDKYRRAQDIGSNPSPTVDYLECCAALLDIEGTTEYKKAIEDASRCSDQAVRRCAEFLLRSEHGRSE